MKLVRDKIPHIAHDPDNFYKLVNDRGYWFLLLNKLVEEAHEVKNYTSEENLIEELADVEEVLMTIRRELRITKKQVDDARRKKFKERGGFYERWVLND